jgi:hypothetical protein
VRHVSRRSALDGCACPCSSVTGEDALDMVVPPRLTWNTCRGGRTRGTRSWRVRASGRGDPGRRVRRPGRHRAHSTSPTTKERASQKPSQRRHVG